MLARHFIRSTLRATVGGMAAVAATALLAGCAMIQPPPVPRVPRLGASRGGAGDAACAADIARAHVALAAVGAAAGDPVGTALAHGAVAEAMQSYHVCLARRGQP